MSQVNGSSKVALVERHIPSAFKVLRHNFCWDCNYPSMIPASLDNHQQPKWRRGTFFQDRLDIRCFFCLLPGRPMTHASHDLASRSQVTCRRDAILTL
jgi:hypothetical protein